MKILRAERSVSKLLYGSILFLFIIAIGLLFVLNYFLFANILNRGYTSQLTTTTSQLKSNLELTMSSFRNTFNNVAVTILHADNLDSGDLNAKLSTIFSTNNDIVTIALFDYDGDLIYSQTENRLKPTVDAKEQSWFAEANTINKFTVPHVQNLFTGKYDWVMSLSRRIAYKKDGAIHPAVLLMDIKFSSIAAVCSGAQSKSSGYVYIVSNEDLIYHTKQQLVLMGLWKEDFQGVLTQSINHTYTSEINGKKYMNHVDYMPYENWYVVNAAYLGDLGYTWRFYVTRLILISVFMLMLILPTSYLFTRRITLPLKDISEKIYGINDRHLDVTFDEDNSILEINMLAESINRLIVYIKRLLREQELKQIELRKAEFASLQTQITPHFLYNILGSIIWMIEDGKKRGAIEMITALTDIFKLNASTTASTIPLSFELEYVDRYVHIQSLRYGNKFEFYIECGPETEAFLCPRMILQPIIENAIEHGLSTLDSGKIFVKAYTHIGLLKISVKDNGIGMTEDSLKELRRSLANTTGTLDSKPGSKAHGIALRNIHNRIQLLYGDGYGLRIESEEDEGTCVIVCLPILR
ncbi:MAG TPA: sensor histidine kinase [Clostridia bacterium]|nr:sensor histidine kinase [Clostridia bacterium]